MVSGQAVFAEAASNPVAQAAPTRKPWVAANPPACAMEFGDVLFHITAMAESIVRSTLVCAQHMGWLGIDPTSSSYLQVWPLGHSQTGCATEIINIIEKFVALVGDTEGIMFSCFDERRACAQAVNKVVRFVVFLAKFLIADVKVCQPPGYNELFENDDVPLQGFSCWTMTYHTFTLCTKIANFIDVSTKTCAPETPPAPEPAAATAPEPVPIVAPAPTVEPAPTVPPAPVPTVEPPPAGETTPTTFVPMPGMPEPDEPATATSAPAAPATSTAPGDLGVMWEPFPTGDGFYGGSPYSAAERRLRHQVQKLLGDQEHELLGDAVAKGEAHIAPEAWPAAPEGKVANDAADEPLEVEFARSEAAVRAMLDGYDADGDFRRGIIDLARVEAGDAWPLKADTETHGMLIKMLVGVSDAPIHL